MTKDIVYKVVRRVKGGTFAPMCEFHEEADLVKYRMKSWTYPPEGWGPLSAFDTLTKAVRMALLYGTSAMHSLTCLAKGDIAILKCSWRPWDSAIMEKPGAPVVFWAETQSGRQEMEMVYVPTGTVLCKAIYPLKIVTLRGIADHLSPGAMVCGVKPDGAKRAFPILLIGSIGFRILLMPPYGEPTRSRINKFLSLLRRKDQALEHVVRQSLAMADSIAKANKIKQIKLLAHD